MSVKKIHELTEIELPGLEDWLAVDVDVGGGTYETKKAHRKSILRLAEIAEDSPLAGDRIMFEKVVSGVPTLYSCLISKLPFTISGGIRWVDKVNGNDSLGTPFKTIGAAKSSSSSGETIVVGPGIYDEKDLLKNGVNFLFLPGATVRYTGASGWIFKDGSSSTDTVICQIAGWGRFEYAGVDASVSGILSIGGDLSDITFQFDSLNSGVGATVNHHGGILRGVRGRRSIGSGGFSLTSPTGAPSIDIDEIAITGGQGIFIQNPSNTIPCVIKGDKISGTQGIRVAGGLVDIQTREIVGQTAGLSIDGTDNDPTVRVRGSQIISTTNTAGNAAIQNDGDLAMIWLDGVKLITQGASALHSIESTFASIDVKVLGQSVANKITNNVNYPSGYPSSRLQVDATLS